eukprot:scaffold26985_cov129-Isochrysis_galbana.AAC.2
MLCICVLSSAVCWLRGVAGAAACMTFEQLCECSRSSPLHCAMRHLSLLSSLSSHARTTRTRTRTRSELRQYDYESEETVACAHPLLLPMLE